MRIRRHGVIKVVHDEKLSTLRPGHLNHTTTLFESVYICMAPL